MKDLLKRLETGGTPFAEIDAMAESEELDEGSWTTGHSKYKSVEDVVKEISNKMSGWRIEAQETYGGSPNHVFTATPTARVEKNDGIIIGASGDKVILTINGREHKPMAPKAAAKKLIDYIEIMPEFRGIDFG